MAVPLAARVVQVEADLGADASPRWRYGSGCIVAARTVLTAGHVVAGAQRLTIKDRDKRTSTASLVFLGLPDSPDLALDRPDLALDRPDLALIEADDPTALGMDPGGLPGMSLARIDRDSETAQEVAGCHAFGYPAFMQTTSTDGVKRRDSVDAMGTVPVLSYLARGLLSVLVTQRPRPLPDEQYTLGQSEWAGMSGGPVVVNGMLLGVVDEHAPREGSSAITAIPLTALEPDPAHPGWGAGVSDPPAWWARLGATGVMDLTVVPRPADRQHEPSPPSPGLIDFSMERMRHTGIIGREAVFTKVREWLGEASQGWILVKGGPGTGKSAILSVLLDRLETTAGPDSVPYHFIRRGQGNWDESDAVVRNLGARLERICGATAPAPSAGPERLHSLLAEAAQRSRDGQPLVLVVDGLDEAALAPGENLGRFLPVSLPEGVFVLCASRPNYPQLGWLEQRPGLRVIDLDRQPWTDDNRDLVEAFWRHRGPQLHPPLDDETIKAAADAAQGNILHAVTLADAFAADTQTRDPRRIPVGFEALLEGMWLRLLDLDGDLSLRVLDGLGLLAIAGEALPLSIVARLLGWRHPAYVAKFKQYALPFLLEEDERWHAGEAHYRPFHESTRSFLTTGDRMSPDVRQHWHELLARELAAWPPADDATAFEREYAARYALMHSAQARDWTRVDVLLADLSHGVAALEALGPQLLRARIADVPASDQPVGLAERADVLRRVLRQEGQWLELHPGALPSLLHNRLTCMGWDRERVRAGFSGFGSGWGLVHAVDLGDELAILRGHTSHVRSCDVDADARLGVSGGWDGTLRVWDLERSTARMVISVDPESPRCDVDSCAISEDGQYVASASVSLLPEVEPRVRVRVRAWRTEDGEPLLDVPFPGDEHAPWVAFAGDRTLVVCWRSGDVDVYDLEQGTKRSLTAGSALFGGIDVDPAGKLLATTTETGCSVRRLSDSGEVCAVPFAPNYLRLCSLSPDGRYVAVVTTGSAVVADAADGSIRFHATRLGDQLSDCCLLDDRRLLFTSDLDCELVVWDMQLDRALVRYGGHTSTANCCAVTPDGRHALSGGGDNTVRLWSLDGKVAAIRPDRHDKLVYGCTVDAQARLACSVPQDEAPTVWDARTGTRRHALPAGVSFVRFCQFGGGQRIAALGHLLQVFDPDTARCLWAAEIPVRDEHGKVSFLASGYGEGRRGGTVLAGRAPLPLLYAGAHAIVWEERSGLRPVALGAEANIVSWFQTGRALAVLHDGKLEVIDLTRANAPKSVATGVLGCVGSPDRYEIYALMEDRSVRRLDARTGAVLQVLGELEYEYADLLIDPEESTVWAAGREFQWLAGKPPREDLTAFVLDGSGAIRRADVTGHKVVGTCFRSGQLITAGWDATVRIWDPHGAMPHDTIVGTSPFRCVDAAEDRIVAGDQRGNLWFLAPMSALYPESDGTGANLATATGSTEPSGGPVG